MDFYKTRAGVPVNVDTIMHMLYAKMNPPVKEIERPLLGPGGMKAPSRPNHSGWNPVYWSDYPKQPMWTVPMPKIPAPVLGRKPPVVPSLPCHYPPTEYLSKTSANIWIPDLPKPHPTWNPYVDESNTPFKPLLGPPFL